MKKSPMPIIIAVIVLVVIVGGISLLASKHKTNNTMPNMSTNTTSNSNASSSSTQTDKVSISNFSFSPTSITVKKGTTVTWTNHDSVAHTVVETDGKTGPNSQPVNDGASYSFTYNSAGTFNYHCSIHPEMVGKVVVTD